MDPQNILDAAEKEHRESYFKNPKASFASIKRVEIVIEIGWYWPKRTVTMPQNRNLAAGGRSSALCRPKNPRVWEGGLATARPKAGHGSLDNCFFETREERFGMLSRCTGGETSKRHHARITKMTAHRDRQSRKGCRWLAQRHGSQVKQQNRKSPNKFI